MFLTDKNRRFVDFKALRSDWYEGGDLMSRALRNAAMARRNDEVEHVFRSFPRQWIPVFELLGLEWEASSDPKPFIPFISGLSEAEVVEETERARCEGQLRLLVEVLASADVVLGETIQRLGALEVPLRCQQPKDDARSIRLANWYSYMRSEIREYEEALSALRPTRPGAIFLPCGRGRPYRVSRTHKHMRVVLDKHGVDLSQHDLIVVTSLGPVPEALWDHPTVLRYDTGVRDIYRMLVLFRRLLRGHRYLTGIDYLGFRPYRDLLSVLKREGFIGCLSRPTGIRSRNITAYR